MSSEVSKAHIIDPADIPPLGPDDVLVGITREEMAILLRHWYEKVCSIERWEFCMDAISPEGTGYANKRARRIMDVLGKEEANKIFLEVEREMQSRLGSEEWRVYCEGTEEERDQLRAKIHVEMQRCSLKMYDPDHTVDYLRAHPTRVFLDKDGDLWFWIARDAADPAQGRPDLHLSFRTASGRSGSTGQVRMPMPDGWFPPYGL